jgi:hypothetical protein
VLLKPFKLLLIKILRTLSVLSKAKLETLEAVEEANVNGSEMVCSRICLANEFRQYLIEGLHLPLYSGFARLSIMAFQDSSMIASAVLVREKTVAPRVLTKILRLYQRCFLIKLIKTAFRFSNFSLSSLKQIIKDTDHFKCCNVAKQCPFFVIQRFIP